MPAIDHHTADLLWESPGSDIEILSMQVRQEISDLYLIQVQIKSPESSLSFQDMLNQTAQIKLKCGAELEDDRFFTGIITRFSQCRTRHGNLSTASTESYLYDVEIRPKLWLLTRQFLSKVYQEMTVQDIASEILDAYGITYEWNIEGSLITREYCVQYEETDYNFICRLLEDEGICFFFNHEDEKTVFSDSSAGHSDCQPTAEATYVEEVSSRFAFGSREFISDFTYEEEIGAGKFALQHYNYETSQTDIGCETEEGEVPCFSEIEHYEHTQNYRDTGEGDPLTDIRKEEEIATVKKGMGRTSCRSFEAGYTMTMDGHFRDDFNCSWLITACDISLEQGHFSCHFEALPADVTFRPIRRTPRPQVTGIQTAMVTGPPGAKVYLDDLGRCIVQFHWDREGERNDRSSMWVRVSNGYAGKDYGIQWIPRVGHEVLVSFVDGDPDLPVVIGRVYNDFNTPPLGPEKKFENIIKTIKDNHIRFSDEDSKELVEIRAQKDKRVLVRNVRTTNIGGHDYLTVKKKRLMLVEEDLHEHVAGDKLEQIDGNYSLTVGGDKQEKIGPKWAVNAQQEVHIKGGLKVVVEAGVEATLKAAGSFIKVDPSGVYVNGPLVYINSGGAAGSGSGSSPATPEDPPGSGGQSSGGGTTSGG